MTLAELKSCTRKELAALAKKHRISGWHPMRKAELIKALASVSSRKSSRSTRSRASASKSKSVKRTATNARTKSRSVQPKTPKRNRAAGSSNGKRAPKMLSASRSNGSRKNGRPNQHQGDAFLTRICDAYWVQVHWELSPDTLARAEAALASEWHNAKPVIRLFDITADDTASTSKRHVRDVEIASDVTEWYVQVDHPDRTYRLHIGFLAPSGRFFALARSKTVRTSRKRLSNEDKWYETNGGSANGNGSALRVHTSGKNGHQDHEEITRSSMFRMNNGRHSADSGEEFCFQIDAEVIIRGATHPHAELAVLGSPVHVGDDGAFSLRFDLPNGRQVIPAIALTPDGKEQRTIVLAIERNTKELEPHVFDETAP